MCSHHDALDDQLDDIFGGMGRERLPADQVDWDSAVAEAQVAMRSYVEKCRKCAGSGMTRWGPCFKCKGKGQQTFRTSPEQRAANRESAARRKEREAQERQEQVEAWKAEHPMEWDWLSRNSRRDFDFAISLVASLSKWGSLTEGQLAAVRRCVQREADRRAERAQIEKAAPAIDVSRIEEAFARAKANKVRWPKLRLDVFKFALAGENSRNPGAIYVNCKDTGTYLGKVQGGRFIRVSACTAEQEAAILAAAADPAAAAEAYGRRYGACSICGRELTVSESIDRAMGPVCAEKYGF